MGGSTLHKNSRNECLKQGMKLLAITRREEYDAAKYLYFYYWNYNGNRFNIDGIYENSAWKFYYPSSGKVFDGALPASNSTGNCMSLVSSGTKIITQSTNCNTGLYTLCEWIKDPKSQ
jgi:hypothetical protein